MTRAEFKTGGVMLPFLESPISLLCRFVTPNLWRLQHKVAEVEVEAGAGALQKDLVTDVHLCSISYCVMSMACLIR